jgi:hypothetical protein
MSVSVLNATDRVQVGLSGLFQGPVIDSGRRLWDWNVNSRQSAKQRWYAGPWPCMCCCCTFAEHDRVGSALNEGCLLQESITGPMRSTE